MVTTAFSYLPDGAAATLPFAPRTWVDAAAGVRGDPLRAKDLSYSASAATVWHRQRPLFQGIATLAQSIPTSTFTAVSGLAELIDNYSGHSDSSNTGRWYCPVTAANNANAGDWYLCTGYIPFNDSDPAHVHIAGLRKNGSTTFEGAKIPGGTGHVVDTMVIDLVQLTGVGSGDYVELVGWQNTGSAVNTVVSGKTPSLTIRWVCQDPSSSSSFTPALPATPHTWADSDIITGSVTGPNMVPLNTEVRDLVRFLHHPPVARLTSQGTSQTIASSTSSWTSISWTSGGNLDNYGGWSSGSPSRYTVQRSGLYFVAGLASMAEAGTNTGYRAVRLLVNGATAYGGMSVAPMSSGTTGTGIYATGLLRLNAGDFIEVQAQQNQGAALSLASGAGNSSRLIAVWMAK